MTAAVPVALSDTLWRQLRQEASRPYLLGGRVPHYFARGKLRHDPLFRALLERGDVSGAARVLDIGCGQGLLAALLHAVGRVHQAGQWPAHGPAAPLNCHYQGFELMQDVTRVAERCLSPLPGAPRFTCADATQVPLPPSDLVLLLDVLHYIDLPAQQVLLQRVRGALSPQGRLLMRVGDASQQRHAFSRWVDRLVVRARGSRARPSFGRPLSSWVDLLHSLGFKVDQVPMSQGTPFANVLLVARVPAAGTLSIEDTA